MGFMAALNKWIAPLDVQNTGRAVYQRPFSVSKVSENGTSGFANFRSMGPFNASTTNAQKIVPASLTGIGNNFNTNPALDPLNNQEQQQSFAVNGSSQF